MYCDLYNISSSNTEIVPIVDYNGYSIDPPISFYNSDESKWKLKVTVPTDILRNSTAGNLIEFYIWSVYNNNWLDPEADGRYAIFSDKMVMNVACGSEKVSVVKSDYILDYNEGSKYFQNETFHVNPTNMTIHVDNPQCPIVNLTVFEDRYLTIPWNNTSFINLVNGDDPSVAYLNITTYETERETWLREIYVLATTIGGQNHSHEPIHVDITIVETFNETEVNHSPQFQYTFPTLEIDVEERDLILRNISKYVYNSPFVVDNEDDPIEILTKDPQHKPFLNLITFSNYTIGVVIDRGLLNYKDEGTHTFQVKLTDDVFSSQGNSKWKQLRYKIVYFEVNPLQYYYFTF